MSENKTVKPSGKISFGCDYLNIMKYMEMPNEKEEYDKDKASIVDAVARLFLLQWDFSVEEVDEACKAFWDKVDSHTLDEMITTVMDRIVIFLKDDKKAQDKFFINLTAVGQMDQTFLDKEGWIPRYFQDKFDIRPSELEQYFKKGFDWRIALDYLGQLYTEYNNNKKTK
jgi:hypothetical protein